MAPNVVVAHQKNNINDLGSRLSDVDNKCVDERRSFSVTSEGKLNDIFYTETAAYEVAA